MGTEILALCLGGVVVAAAMQLARGRRAARDTETWVIVGSMNTLLRLDLDHLVCDDDSHGLRELCAALNALAATRGPAERTLLERYNALCAVAIASGESVHDQHGVVDMRAVAKRRADVQHALVLGDQLEAALGGIAELARRADVGAHEPTREHDRTGVEVA